MLDNRWYVRVCGSPKNGRKSGKESYQLQFQMNALSIPQFLHQVLFLRDLKSSSCSTACAEHVKQQTQILGHQLDVKVLPFQEVENLEPKHGKTESTWYDYRKSTKLQGFMSVRKRETVFIPQQDVLVSVISSSITPYCT